MTESLRVALVTDVFHGPNSPERLIGTLENARAQGADVAVLPELPLNDWCPVRRTRAAADVELAGGSRQRALARAARQASLAVLGGAIVENPISGRRYNTAILYDAAGGVVTTYRKVHIPYEEGFWEADHYEAGDELARPVSFSGFQVGIQVCSDANRPESFHLLGAMGALAVLSPRATPPDTFERWRYVLRANAVTSSVYVISVNRPAEPGSPVGGPSLAIAPDGAVLVESTESVSVVTLERRVVEDARTTYPGYLAVRAELYARGWSELAESRAGDADAERPYRRSVAALSGPASIDTNPRQD